MATTKLSTAPTTVDSLATQSGQYWNGSYVTGGDGATPTGLLVRYHGPTNTLGGRWVATLRHSDGSRAAAFTASFQTGPLAAARGLLDRQGWQHWALLSIAYVDGDTYHVSVQPGSTLQ